MDNNNDKNEEIKKTEEPKSSFITEKVKPKTRRKIRKALEVCGFALLAALIIGFVGRLVFEASGGVVGSLLGRDGVENEDETQPPRTEVVLSTVKGHGPGDVYVATSTGKEPTGTESAKKQEKVTPQATPSPTVVPEVVTPIPMPDAVSTPKDTTGEGLNPVELVTTTPAPEESSGKDSLKEEEKQATPLENYISIISDMQQLDRDVSASIVTVRACNSGINWLDENIETYTEGTGVILGENGVEMLIMASFSRIENADRIEVILADGYTVDGEIFLTDEVYNLAIVGVKLSDITAKEKTNLRCICIGDSDNISRGDAIMAVGMPDGYSGSVEYGFVSAVGRTCYVQDGILKVFATGLTYHQQSDAVIVNMAGELIGIVSHQVEQSEEDRITSCVAINSVKEVLIDLLNGKKTPKLGVRAEDMPEDVLEGMELTNGIYVNEVISGSPAATAGLRKGDIITRIGEEPIESIYDLMSLLLKKSSGEEVNLEFYRSSMRDEPVQMITIKFE